MAGIDVSVSKELLPGLLGSQDGLAKLVEAVLNQILEAQLTESLGAERHERSDDRTGYRNGHRTRTLYTRVGPVTLLVPQTRDGSFSTDIFKRYQRSEQAFVLALMEMVVQGVSTRKVSAITEELCGASFSKSTVSSLCVGLDARVKVATVVLFIVVVGLVHSLPMLAGILVLILCFGLLSKIPLGLFLKRILIFIPLFTAVIAVPALFITPGEPLVTMGSRVIITEQNVNPLILFHGVRRHNLL